MVIDFQNSASSWEDVSIAPWCLGFDTDYQLLDQALVSTGRELRLQTSGMRDWHDILARA